MIAETQRLRLRHVVQDDERDLVSLLTHNEVMRFSDGVLSVAEVHQWIEARQQEYRENPRFGLFAVIRKWDERFIGYSGLSRYPIAGEVECELGFRLMPEAWGQGFATEAARALVDHSFSRLQARRLIAVVDPDNSRSIGVVRKLGMTYWRDILLPSYDHPDQVYRLTREQWIAAPYLHP